MLWVLDALLVVIKQVAMRQSVLVYGDAIVVDLDVTQYLDMNDRFNKDILLLISINNSCTKKINLNNFIKFKIYF